MSYPSRLEPRCHRIRIDLTICSKAGRKDEKSGSGEMKTRYNSDPSPRRIVTNQSRSRTA